MTAPGEDAIEGIHQGVFVGAAMPPHTKDGAAAGVADSLGYHAHRMDAHGGKGTHGGIGTLSDVGESPAVPPLFAACARSHRYGRGGLTVRGSRSSSTRPSGKIVTLLGTPCGRVGTASRLVSAFLAPASGRMVVSFEGMTAPEKNRVGFVVERDNRGHWLPGRSANPGGRPGVPWAGIHNGSEIERAIADFAGRRMAALSCCRNL